MNYDKLSRLMSFCLRHKPQALHLSLDKNGWCDLHQFYLAISANHPCTFDDIIHVVNTCPKKRYQINEDSTKIRASQGHSIEVDLNLQKKEPPDKLYHGTSMAACESIRVSGLTKQKRHHVHLSADLQTAIEVANRRGKDSFIFRVNAKAMHAAGYSFYISENGVWLTDHVPCEFLY